MFDHYHIKTINAGPQLLLNTVRQKFWPIDGRNMARSVVHNCVICTCLAAQLMKNPVIANLRRERVQMIFPFTDVSIDFAGPLQVVNKIGRGVKIIKCYVCIFVCFSTKTIHIELCSDPYTEKFMQCLALSVLFLVAVNQLIVIVAMLQILWELEMRLNVLCQKKESVFISLLPILLILVAFIRMELSLSSTIYVRRVVGLARLTYEELLTSLIRIEAILNSHTLSILSSSPNKFIPLSPRRFLIGRSSNALPGIIDEPTNRLPLYQRVEQLRQHVWTRWNMEYIGDHQRKSK